MKIVFEDAPNITFTGRGALAICDAHAPVVEALLGVARVNAEATITVHVSPRIDDDEPLEWSMCLVSPAGRRTFDVVQRAPTGAVLINNRAF